MDEYYNEIAQGYDELHEFEQLQKVALIKEQLNIQPETTLLDVGCGTGISSQFDCDVTGIDPSEALLKKAKKKFPDKQFIAASAEELPFEDHSFDIVVSITAIQNFDDVEKGLQEIRRVGKKQFALSYLKRSFKAKSIEETITKLFPKNEKIEEEKDIIFIIKE